MPQGNPGSFSFDTNQQIPLSFDFSGALDCCGNDAIAEVLSITITDQNGVDTNPTARLLGSPFTVTSPLTGIASAAVTQTVGNGVAGANYLIVCVVSLLSGGSTPSLWVLVACNAPGTL